MPNFLCVIYSKVSFGTSAADLSQSVIDNVNTTEHEIKLTGLSQDTKYFYSTSPALLT
jgi:hypothetical protein